MLEDRWDLSGWAEASPGRRHPSLARCLPLGVVERVLTARRALQRRRSGAGRWLTEWHATEYDGPLGDAVERAGGFQRIKEAQHRLYERRYAARAAMAIVGDRWWRSRARVVGDELLPRDSPCMLLVPHLGLPMLPQAHLLSLGRRVCMPAYDPSGRFIAELRLLDRFGPKASTARLRLLRVPHPLLGTWAVRALRAGYDLTWQPDTRIGLAAGRGPRVEFLGRERAASPLLYRIWSATRVPVVAAAAAEESADATRHRLSYHPVPVDGAREAEFLQTVYREIEGLILANVAYWTQLRYYPDV